MATNPTGTPVAAPAGVGPHPEVRQAPGAAAFDLWLRRGLQRAFDAVVAEPVPDDLLRLIREGEARGRR